MRDGELDVISCGPGFDVAMLDFADVIEGATRGGAATATASGSGAPAPRPGADRREGGRLAVRRRVLSRAAGVTARGMYIGIGTLIIIIILLIILL